MKAIMVMFDSLNRRMLEPYGCDWVNTPNFKRLSEKTITFENSYAGSMPCMPARRELHTGRYNFLHRGWGPLEPFDDSMPELLKKNEIYTHLVTDHYHYFEDGGATYHTKYNTWEMVRGHEGEPWKGQIAEPDYPENFKKPSSPMSASMMRQDFINRSYMKTEEQMPMPLTFDLGMEFIEKNVNEDNWFLQLETFDPHEPYFTPEAYKEMYPHSYDGPHFDWPPYDRVTQDEKMVEHCRYESAALHSMCDTYMGKVLDMMDQYDLWKDTMLIVNTDHGFLLGEHDWWAKSIQPFYDEIIHTPLFIWDPRCGVKNERRQSLVSTIDLAPTLLDYFHVAIPKDMDGQPLKDTIANDKKVHDYVLFGVFGSHVNITDGRFVYMRGGQITPETPIYEYTLMPCNMRHTMTPGQLKNITLSPPLAFTKNCPVLVIPGQPWPSASPETYQTMLFDLQSDPGQTNPIQNSAEEDRMIQQLEIMLKENHAPEEQFHRLGL